MLKKILNKIASAQLFCQDKINMYIFNELFAGKMPGYKKRNKWTR
jgi:hypothetical protein